jgi:hypothetical protein
VRTLYRYEAPPRSIISLHKRIHCARGEYTFEPPTYWLTLTMPWRIEMYDVNTDAMQRTFPRLSIGFRFRFGV